MLKSIVQCMFMCVLVLAFTLAGCAREDTASKEETADTQMMKQAVAKLSATEGNEAHGTVTFSEVETGVRVVARFEGVPEGDHGFHIHQFGDCSSGDGKSAGGHFNPDGVDHAGPDAELRHVGDLGNITANADGVAEKDYVDTMLAFEGARSIIGKGVILHANPDDLTTQPTGAAGARIACGVIEWTKESLSDK
ncbi:MAG: superoxide dismutase family protein [bacterium]